MDLCLYAFVVQFPDDLLNDPSWISDRALLLPGGDGRRRESHDGYREYLSHKELLYMIALRLPKVENGNEPGCCNIAISLIDLRTPTRDGQ